MQQNDDLLNKPKSIKEKKSKKMKIGSMNTASPVLNFFNPWQTMTVRRPWKN